jgi:carboxyl-terminal processing protease
VKTALLLLLVILLTLRLPAAAEAFPSGQALDQRTVAQVTTAALAFMTPRTLEAVPVWQLSLWGLRGLATIDPRLAVELHEGELRLSQSDRPVLALAAPAPDDDAGWGAAVAALVRAAWDVSEPMRKTGTTGILRTFFDELFNHLDPYSRYAPPSEAVADQERRAGRAGVGLTLARRAGGFVVQDVVADGPAAQSGVRAGDVIVAVDGQNTQGADLSAVNALLAGPEGSWVTVSLRGRDGRTRVAELVRALVPPETVTASRVGDLLVLRVTGFASDTAARLAREIVRGLTGPRATRGLVIDLRGNRGGLLRQAAAAAETLLPGGLVAMTAGRDPQAAHEFRAEGRDLAAGLPVVVIVDGRTASAAEILAAALADDGRAVVVGSATMGKGLVQTIAPLPDGGELLVTWSRVLAPLGWPIQALGVLPQVCTSLGLEALNRQLAELAHGGQPLARALGRHRAARAPLPPAEILEIRNACPAAEGRDADLTAARFLIDTPSAYAAALLAGSRDGAGRAAPR